MSSIVNHIRQYIDSRRDHRQRDLLIIAGALLVILLLAWWRPTLPTAEDITVFTAQWGAAGPLALMLVIILESVLAPIPGTFISIAAGVLYGVWPGVLYVWVANIIGSSLSFLIARYLGRRVVERIVKPESLARYDAFFKRNPLLILLAYMMPILFPVDMMGYVLGLAGMRYRRFVVFAMVGFAVNLTILTTFGSQLLDASNPVRLMYLGGMVVLVLIALYVQNRIKRKYA